MRRLDVYRRWFLEHVMEAGKKSTLLVMQSEDVKPNYRDDPPPYEFSTRVRRRINELTVNREYYIQPAWNQWWISSILGAPEVVIPAGQIPYISRITETVEELPVATSIMGEPSMIEIPGYME